MSPNIDPLIIHKVFMMTGMSEYAFRSVTESPEAKRGRQQRMVVSFALTLACSVGVQYLWRRFYPDDSSHLWDGIVDGLIACVVSIMQGENTKISAEKLRHEFKLRIDVESIIRERNPLTLSRREIRGVYLAPHKSLWIMSNDSRRKIVVPGDLEEREQLIRDLIGMGLPLRTFSDWLVDVASRRLLIAMVVSLAVVALWLPGPTWRLLVATVVLLSISAWYSVRVGSDPNVDYVGLERFCITLLAIGILWRDAHLLFGLWPR